jgi:hypothetical protein
MTEVRLCGRVGALRVAERNYILQGKQELNFYLSSNFLLLPKKVLEPVSGALRLFRVSGMIADSRGSRIAQPNPTEMGYSLQWNIMRLSAVNIAYSGSVMGLGSPDYFFYLFNH